MTEPILWYFGLQFCHYNSWSVVIRWCETEDRTATVTYKRMQSKDNVDQDECTICQSSYSVITIMLIVNVICEAGCGFVLKSL